MSIPPIISQKNKSAKHSLIHWKSENPKAYLDFICQIEQAKDGDYSAYVRIFETAIECIPQEVIDECKVLFGDTELCQDAYYEELIAEFMNFHGFIKLSFAEGDIEVETITEKNVDDPTSIYIPVKGKEEWWSSIPFMYRMLANMFVAGKSEPELCYHARRILIVAFLTLTDFIERLQERTKEKNDPFMMSVLYWITFDHGIKHSLQILSGILTSQQGLGVISGLIPAVMGKMTSAGVNGATETKAEIRELVTEETNVDAKREMRSALAETKGQHGRPRTEFENFDIKEHLKGNHPKLIKLIRDFRKEHSCITHITYLYKAMDDAGCLKGTDLVTFFHCIENLEGKKYNMDKAKRYHNQMLGKNSEYNTSKKSRWLMARRIVMHWTDVFSEASK